jgi:hypothetical protein
MPGVEYEMEVKALVSAENTNGAPVVEIGLKLSIELSERTVLRFTGRRSAPGQLPLEGPDFGLIHLNCEHPEAGIDQPK